MTEMALQRMTAEDVAKLITELNRFASIETWVGSVGDGAIEAGQELRGSDKLSWTSETVSDADEPPGRPGGHVAMTAGTYDEAREAEALSHYYSARRTDGEAVAVLEAVGHVLGDGDRERLEAMDRTPIVQAWTLARTESYHERLRAAVAKARELR